jgi:hypothetical protein
MSVSVLLSWTLPGMMRSTRGANEHEIDLVERGAHTNGARGICMFGGWAKTVLFEPLTD